MWDFRYHFLLQNVQILSFCVFLSFFSQISYTFTPKMNDEIRQIGINEFLQLLPEKQENVMTSEVMLMMDSEVVRPMVAIGQPYQLHEGRLLRVVRGRAQLTINLRTTLLTAQSVCILPPDAIIQYEEVSDDYRIQGFSYTSMPATIAFDCVTVLHLSKADFQRTGNYLQLIRQVLHKENYSLRTIQLLQMALLNDLHHIQSIEAEQQAHVQPSRQEEVFNRFIDLVNQYGLRERNISFYAERLLLSPNRLSTIIKDYSGQTVMQWLNQKTLLQAKVLLRHSDMMIYEIADRLGFAESTTFNRYFKREVSMTPLKYKRQ